jgi:SP family sugar:H+ symporter-like MFS transporter
MEDWLTTFGTFQPNLPAGLGANDHFLPTNRKSLVVSRPDLPFPWRAPTA